MSKVHQDFTDIFIESVLNRGRGSDSWALWQGCQ